MVFVLRYSQGSRAKDLGIRRGSQVTVVDYNIADHVFGHVDLLVGEFWLQGFSSR